MKKTLLLLGILISIQGMAQDRAKRPQLMVKLPFLSASGSTSIRTGKHSAMLMRKMYQVLPVELWAGITPRFGLGLEASYGIQSVLYKGQQLQVFTINGPVYHYDKKWHSRLKYQLSGTYHLWQSKGFSQELYGSFHYVPRNWNANTFFEHPIEQSLEQPNLEGNYYRYYIRTVVQQESRLMFWSLGTRCLLSYKKAYKIGIKATWDIIRPVNFRSSISYIGTPPTPISPINETRSIRQHMLNIGIDFYIDIFQKG